MGLPHKYLTRRETEIVATALSISIERENVILNRLEQNSKYSDAVRLRTQLLRDFVRLRDRLKSKLNCVGKPI